MSNRYFLRAKIGFTETDSSWHHFHCRKERKKLFLWKYYSLKVLLSIFTWHCTIMILFRGLQQECVTVDLQNTCRDQENVEVKIFLNNSGAWNDWSRAVQAWLSTRKVFVNQCSCTLTLTNTRTHTLYRGSPAWARLNEQAERVSGETEGPQRLPGKSEPDLPGERESEKQLDLYLCF